MSSENDPSKVGKKMLESAKSSIDKTFESTKESLQQPWTITPQKAEEIAPIRHQVWSTSHQ
jgi:hypothetical protein